LALLQAGIAAAFFKLNARDAYGAGGCRERRHLSG
jgi:hypothetical protein